MNIPPKIKPYNQNLNTQTLNACTIFSIVHMLLHNNIVKNEVGINEQQLTIFCERMTSEGILTPVGSRMDEVLDYICRGLRKKRKTIMTKPYLMEILNKGYSVVGALAPELLVDASDDGIINGSWNVSISDRAHAACFWKDGDNIMAYDSLAEKHIYQIDKFYDRIPSQIWQTFVTVI